MYDVLWGSQRRERSDCLLRCRRDRSVYAAIASLHLPFSTLDLTPLIYRGSGITYRNENKNIEQRLWTLNSPGNIPPCLQLSAKSTNCADMAHVTCVTWTVRNRFVYSVWSRLFATNIMYGYMDHHAMPTKYSHSSCKTMIPQPQPRERYFRTCRKCCDRDKAARS